MFPYDGEGVLLPDRMQARKPRLLVSQELAGVVDQMQRLVLVHGLDRLPYRAIKTNIADSLNIIVQIERRPGNRFVSEVLEIRGYDLSTDQYHFHQVAAAVEG